jgi:uncharacterized cupin superfamily protein
MGGRKLNVVSCRLDESLDRAGFRHVCASIGQQLGAARLGASVYEAYAGHPIWPYHYHHAAEEWLYVISGTPMLRDPGGPRELSSGDTVCFPAGHLGAHTVNGPGRFIVLSADAPGPYVAVYPDSDKIAVWPGVPELDALTLPRAAAVDYWHGEGSEASSEPAEVLRETAAPSRPIVNALAVPVHAPAMDASPGSRFRTAQLAPTLGSQRLAVTVLELDPGEGSTPYHYSYGREKWLLVLAGTPTMRHPDGEDLLQPADLVCFPEGPAGAHHLVNRHDQTTRVAFFSSTGLPVNICHPDTGEWLVRNEANGEDLKLH